MVEKRSFRLRPWIRAAHRDLGYLAVGLTVVYAVSGIAVNHVADWDPNYRNYQSSHEIGPVPADDALASAYVLQRVGISEKPKEIYRASPEQLEILFDRQTIHVNTKTGIALVEGQRPRFLLKTANFLHLNRGKKAWSYVADGYAAGLLLLSISGLFMIPGRKGLLGRGGVLLLVGALIPIIYVVFVGK